MPVPRVVEPSLKVTVPVGVPEPLVGVTVAVKVTVWPNVGRVGLTRRRRRRAASWLTAWVSVGEVLVVKLLSPP